MKKIKFPTYDQIKSKAEDRAKCVLSAEDYKSNGAAVLSIKSDFFAGVNYLTSFLSDPGERRLRPKLKFEDWGSVMEDVLQYTFNKEVKIKRMWKQDWCWYFQYHNGAYDVYLAVPKHISDTKYFHIIDGKLNVFYEEFNNSANRWEFPLDRRDIINHYEGVSFDVIESYRFVEALRLQYIKVKGLKFKEAES